MAFAIVHHLDKKNNIVTHCQFADLLMEYSRKYILIENIGGADRQQYEKIFVDNGYKLIGRQHNGPNKRHISLYRKVT